MSAPCGHPPDRDIGFGSVRVVRAGEAKLREGVGGEGSLNAGPPGPKKCRVPRPSEAYVHRENTYSLVKNAPFFSDRCSQNV